MAAKTTLNAKNLEALGAQRLAELLIEISTGSAAHKRRLRMEIAAGNHSSADVSREVRKRLSSIMRARTFIDWRKVKAMKTDLETQRKTIIDTVALHDPVEAFELIWQFLAVADPLFGRSDDGSGSLIQSFHQACNDAGAIAKAANIDIDVLAEKIFKALQDNGYGQFDRLITAMIPALENDGLRHLRALFVTWSKEPKEKARKTDRTVISWSSAGAIYEEVYGNHNDLTIRIALQEIADALGDVDAYIAQQPEKTHAAPMVAADIAHRLVSAGRAEEALKALDKVDTNGRTDVPFEWELARIEVLEALGRGEEAQAFRWRCFEQSLHDEHLRAYVRRLPDFDDIEAEAKAFGYAQAFPNVHRALHFFLRWPSPAEAANLVMKREAELDGDLYGLMTAVADALSAKHPLAATVVLRSMIDFTLRSGRSSRYKHAARHLAECRSLASQIKDFGSIQSNDAYVADLKREHGRKSGFWSLAQ
ncbi:hypothetical protein DSM25558_5375 [Agrobacterium sp. DSM 25558]|uniref:DUF6880 family protein n=1 Tax=Agrobacterium sp. DSM 25558 TaxID=1907665 RepID=UPI0009725612|nr:DUF6880 family protein [Agrobacterium sp. DSM 25558]SCX32066.1 hypothetical protein DSM25558_5375 [Agrobacterium sp. DSM 25558]